MEILNLFTNKSLLEICIFVSKPILILIVCKIIITLLLKVGHNVLEKSKLDDGIKNFAKSAIKIILWVFISLKK